ncbi:2-hydroxychromene-2-carboxylate isomerase [Nocardia sp. NPDC127579]|uniref:2-hydroxychromene-2-carboxylate isomerase n=1 Tax=Nocardia sp. NPDC127579 TaxID=3345402 RepID=UPI003626D806
MNRKSTPPRHYFSFRSPYSWLAFRDMKELYGHLPDELTWIPYWDPDEDILARTRAAGADFVYVPMSKEKHRYLLQDIRRLTQRRNLRVTWPFDNAVRWEVAHIGYFPAAEQGRGLEYIDRVYQARWTEGRAIDDPAVIADIATELGLDPELVSTAADDPRYRDLAVEALSTAFHDDVFGPPLFIVGRQKYWGLERLEEFVEAVRARGNPEPVADITPADTDQRGEPQLVGADISHAGGCG